MSMRTIQKISGLLLAVILMFMCGVPAAATQTETPAGTQAPAETVPAETAPPETARKVYTVDETSEIYQICDALAEGMASDQLLVYDSTNDEILYTRSREGEKLYPASVTKLFSCYVALQYLDPWEVLTAGDELQLVKAGSSRAWISKRHQLYTRTVVEAMMLPSGNDAAMILAAAAGKKIAGDANLGAEEAVQAFVAEMNRMAQELGFERSHFSNPDGYHVGSHYTCLADMARIAKLALENETISRFIKVYTDDVTFVSGQTITWENTNLLLNPTKGFYRSDAIGMKTGYTRQAEYCLMSAFKCSDGRILVIGSFGSADENDRFREAIALADACQEQFRLEAEQAKAQGAS